MQEKASPEIEERLAKYVAQFRYDAYGFVMAVFPWGQKGTVLEKKRGPEPWQKELLDAVSQHRRDNADMKAMLLDMIPWRSAVASGHGIGKSALVAWLIYWIFSTSTDARGVATANTSDQLETKTWPELAKWHGLAINRHWFTWTASSFFFAKYPEDKRKNYMINALTVSEQNTEAFAGLHNEGRAIIILFDEASGIDRAIWEVIEGAQTDGEVFFFSFGNPTRPDGPFAERFMDPVMGKGFYLKHVDSREVSHTNKVVIADLIERYGEDSDVVRIRVKGTFPEKAYDGYISPATVAVASEREAYHDTGVGLVMAVDVARYGDDATVLGFRRGTDARTIPWLSFRGLNNVQVAERVAEQALKYKPNIICIESIGPGIGVIDILKTWGYRVVEVFPNGSADDPVRFFNKRAELWSRMRDWLMGNGAIPPIADLHKEIPSVRYKTQGDKLLMEPKKDMKERGLPSPDHADTLALTFAAKPQRRDAQGASRVALNQVSITEYDPLAYSRDEQSTPQIQGLPTWRDSLAAIQPRRP